MLEYNVHILSFFIPFFSSLFSVLYSYLWLYIHLFSSVIHTYNPFAFRKTKSLLFLLPSVTLEVHVFLYSTYSCPLFFLLRTYPYFYTRFLFPRGATEVSRFPSGESTTPWSKTKHDRDVSGSSLDQVIRIASID